MLSSFQITNTHGLGKYENLFYIMWTYNDLKEKRIEKMLDKKGNHVDICLNVVQIKLVLTIF